MTGPLGLNRKALADVAEVLVESYLPDVLGRALGYDIGEAMKSLSPPERQRLIEDLMWALNQSAHTAARG